MMRYLQMGLRRAVAQLEETGDQRVASLRLIRVTVMCSWARQRIRGLVIAQPWKTGNRPNLTRIFLLGHKASTKTKQMDPNQSIRWSDVTK